MTAPAPCQDFRIAIVLEDLRIGGTVHVTLKYASSFASLGYDVTLIVIETANREAEIGNDCGIKTIIFTGPCTLMELSGIMDQYDAVIISNGGISPFALEASRFTAKPLIVELLHNFFKAAATPSVDMTVAVSVPVFLGMQPREQDVFIPNGVDVCEFRPVERKVKERVTIIQIAREGKIMDPALETIAEDLINEGLPVDAFIIGRDGCSSQEIRYLGVQPYARIRTLLQESDILLHMPVSEPFGMTAIEAMATGAIPVVANVDGLPFSVENGKTGYVVAPGDKEGVKSTLRGLVFKIAEGHPDITKMRREAIKRVHEKFNLSILTGQFVSLIKERSETMHRQDRSSGYPFSFVASFLFYDLKNSAYFSDYYFAVMEDIVNATDLESALADWREYLAIVRHGIRNPPGFFDFLDEVYSNMVYEKKSEDTKKTPACFFWLALLALTMQRYDKMVQYLGRGNGQRKTGGPMGVLLLRRIVFSLICYRAYFMKQPVSEEMLRAGRSIKEHYCSDDIMGIERLSGNDDILADLIKGAGFPGLPEAIENSL